MRLRTDGIKAMSCDFSGDKQVIILSSARNRGRVCLFLTTENEQLFILKTISNGNRTEWSPIQSVIIRVINKIG